MCVDGENAKDPGDAQDRQQHGHRLGSEPTQAAGGKRKVTAMSVVGINTIQSNVHVQGNSPDSVGISVNLVALCANARYDTCNRNQDANVDLDREHTHRLC